MNKLIVSLLVLLVASSCAQRHALPPAAEKPFVFDGSIDSESHSHQNPVVSTGGMVVADDREAAEWGAEILRQGGNAVDAAVATAFAMAVTRPHYAAIGGGGFLLYCPKRDQFGSNPCQIMDYREQAPGKATRDMYVRNGKGNTDLSQDGALASGVPGVTAGLLAALDRFGSMPRRKLLSRPIELARNGYRFSSHTEQAASERWDAMNEEARRIFGCGTAKPCATGALVKQPDLARVLEEISRKGAPGFYDGWVAGKIVDGIQKAGGILTLKDFAAYQPKMRTPLRGVAFGHEVVTMPPPSAGGALILQMLGFAERADRQGALANGIGSAETIHALAHGMKLSFADRAKFFGDPDFVTVPIPYLTSPEYLDRRWKTFDPGKAVAVDPGFDELPPEPSHTTHFSVIDRNGNAVAITTTVNDDFGSGFVPPGTGVVMNNEMDDFSIQPGVPNLFGLVGAEANSIRPYKRPLSSMSPTIVRDLQGNVELVIGAAGGPTITTSVFLTIINRLRFNLSMPDAVSAPRFHHQWKPDELRVEHLGLSPREKHRLVELGYPVVEKTAIAHDYGLERFPNGRVWGAPEPRGEGAAVAEATH